jgi:hypothetical protein
VSLPALEKPAHHNVAAWGYREPESHVVIGKVTDPERLAHRIMCAVRDLGAVQLICRGGRFAAAIPGSRMSLMAERAKPCAIVATYVTGVSRAQVVADIRHELEAARRAPP